MKVSMGTKTGNGWSMGKTSASGGSWFAWEPKKHKRFGILHLKKCDLLFKKSDFATYMIEPSEIRM